MTYDPMTRHSNPHIGALPGAVGTHMILAGLAAGMKRLSVQTAKPGIRGVLSGLRAQIKILYRIEARNFKRWLRWSLQAMPSWRQSVLEDLGGQRALRQWERRAEKAQHLPSPSRAQQSAHKRRASSGQSCGPSRVKTDALGLFRLAPIKRSGAETPERHRRTQSFGARGPGALFPAFKPVHLTPGDLRGYGQDSICMGGETATPDPSATIEPQNLWNELIRPLMDAADRLADLDRQITNAEQLAATPPPASNPPVMPTAQDGRAAYAVTHPD